MVDFIKPKNASSVRAAHEVLETLNAGDADAFKQQVVIAMERLAELNEIGLAAKAIMVKALEESDSVALLSMHVKISDLIMEYLSKDNERLSAQFRSQTNPLVEKILKKHVRDAFYQKVETGNIFREDDVKRAIAENLREIADQLMSEYDLNKGKNISFDYSKPSPVV